MRNLGTGKKLYCLVCVYLFQHVNLGFVVRALDGRWYNVSIVQKGS